MKGSNRNGSGPGFSWLDNTRALQKRVKFEWQEKESGSQSIDKSEKRWWASQGVINLEQLHQVIIHDSESVDFNKSVEGQIEARLLDKVSRTIG